LCEKEKEDLGKVILHICEMKVMAIGLIRTYLKINASAHGKARNREKAEHTRSM
jgi:hypothetical protein